ncbi:hypothetical protein AX769_14605 [Frondihabitans sp. PAMC 28766]|uniref:hypothetical protein n=1 Tax=Frondihabitans sp. PAMC 28766 TaxID=1795630 RepID=UPI00078C1A94|nr:hypothetical protein [Frondihabitans sp. PAMC 28766]AMM21141.1 hypothetical protein AX769_14605 [Frondihabitans sp. PAMC 28766]
MTTFATRSRRRSRDDRATLQTALREVAERRVLRFRAALEAAVAAPQARLPTASGPAVLVLGRGAVDVLVRAGPEASPSTGELLRLDGAPLVVRADRGVRVLGPPVLARLVAESYAAALLGPGLEPNRAATPGRDRVSKWHEPLVDGGSCLIELGETSRADEGYLGAEVWLAPDGTACARTPSEARGRWVPVDLEW